MSPAETYQASLRDLADAKSKAELVAKSIRDAGLAFAQWRWVTITNTSAMFPTEVALNLNAPHIDAREWPSADQMAGTLTKYHAALHQARQEWENLPLEDRTGLLRPEV